MTRRPEERDNHQGFTYQTPEPARQCLEHRGDQRRPRVMALVMLPGDLNQARWRGGVRSSTYAKNRARPSLRQLACRLTSSFLGNRKLAPCQQLEACQ